MLRWWWWWLGVSSPPCCFLSLTLSSLEGNPLHLMLSVSPATQPYTAFMQIKERVVSISGTQCGTLCNTKPAQLT